MTNLGAVLVVASLSIVAVRSASAAFYPLELTNIKPIGDAPDGLDANNRIYRAFPGIEYNIRAAVIGGDFPFTYSLTNAPAGMTIDPVTGQISWPNPQANAIPTIGVRDAAGAQVSVTWPITVTTSGFAFLDAANGRNAAGNGCSSACGNGTIDNPWRTVKDMHLNARAGTFAYFRDGTYTVLDLPRANPGGYWDRVEFLEQSRPVVWMAYPGASPRIDFGYQPGVEAAPMIRFGGSNVYVDGFETIRSRIMGFQVAHRPNRGSTFRRLTMRDTGPGVDGSNAAFIMYLQNYPNQAYGSVIQDSTFCGVTGEGTTIKTYSVMKLLVENTTHCNAHTALELKSDTSQFTVRGNLFRDLVNKRHVDAAIGGNMHKTHAQTYGEILFNTVLYPKGIALRLNQDGQAREIYVHRNTLVGRVQLDMTDSNTGPFTLSNNVIVSDDRGVHYSGRSNSGRTVLSDNLVGRPSDKLVDGSGNLTAAKAKHIGTHGHMQGAGAATPRRPH